MIWEKSDMVDFIIYSFYNYFIKKGAAWHIDRNVCVLFLLYSWVMEGKYGSF